MHSKLIKLEDGTLVEVDIPEDQAQQISGGIADKVKATFNKIEPLLKNTCRPVVSAMTQLDQEIRVEQAEVQIGFSFEAEGNLYVTKSKASANLTVKLHIKPRE